MEIILSCKTDIGMENIVLKVYKFQQMS